MKSVIYYITAGLMWFAVFMRFSSAQIPSTIYGETPPAVGLKLQTVIADQLHENLPQQKKI